MDSTMIDGAKGMMGRQTDPTSATLISRLMESTNKRGAAPAAPILLNTLEQMNSATCAALAAGLIAVADRMDGREASDVRRKGLEVMVTTLQREPSKVSFLAQTLIPLAEKMHPADAAEVLAKVMENEADVSERGQFATAFTTAVAKLEPALAARMFSSAAARETEPQLMTPLVAGLAVAAEQLNPTEAEEICHPLAQRIASTISGKMGPDQLGAAALNLTTISPRIAPIESRKLCDTAARILTTAINNERDPLERQPIVRGLASLSVRLAHDEAVKVVRLVAATAWDYDDRELHTLLTTSMALADAPKTARILLASFQQETDPHARWMLAAGLFLVSQRLGSVEAARYCAPVLPALIAAFDRDGEKSYSYMAEGLASLTSAIDIARTGEARRSIGGALARKGSDRDLRQTLIRGLAAAEVRSGTEEVEKFTNHYIVSEQDIQM